uniref:Uncharacterized protein n=1 Tax=Taeniopygia guttata TaxID=59729 RepID=A0A674HQT1_TAEGU
VWPSESGSYNQTLTNPSSYDKKRSSTRLSVSTAWGLQDKLSSPWNELSRPAGQGCHCSASYQQSIRSKVNCNPLPG